MNQSKIKYVSYAAPNELITWITSMDYQVQTVLPVPGISNSISSHADIQMCRLGCKDDSPIIHADKAELQKLEEKYPRDIPFNAACTGKYLIANMKYTNHRIIEEACKSGMALVDVPQGYAKCSTVIVDERSIITYDEGIAKVFRGFDVDVLLIEPGYISLEGYNTGFIGGASGRVGNTIVFCGDITSHPNAAEILEFIKKRGLDTMWFDFPLTDIGSII